MFVTLFLSVRVCLRERKQRKKNGVCAAMEGVASADTTRFVFVLVLRPELFQGLFVLLRFFFLLLLLNL